MKVLVTGANGFIGKNLVLRLREQADTEVLIYVRGQDNAVLNEALRQCDAVVHLAGENRPADVQAFADVNVGLTERICQSMRAQGRLLPLILTSSAQVELDNPYGRSKLAAEQTVQVLAHEQGNPVAIYRLPGVFGKWCKPNYNSVVPYLKAPRKGPNADSPSASMAWLCSRTGRPSPAVPRPGRRRETQDQVRPGDRDHLCHALDGRQTRIALAALNLRQMLRPY